jgi:hypothetical protein
MVRAHRWKLVDVKTCHCAEFKEMLEYLDVIVLEPRALRLFAEADLNKGGRIDIGFVHVV